ncbi:MAG TPA: ParB/RepB/Spo0J family partition protein [Tepidisphaeraceae bacterium]|jgi:ParB family chromosome partitioning protein
MSQRIIQQIELSKIISGKQPRERFDEESLLGLTQSMRESGQQEPIHVIPLDGDMYSLLTGGRRVRAARKAGWATVAAIVEKSGLSQGEVLIRQIIENAQREDLTPLEKAKAIDSLMKETGWNATQTASKLGFSNGTVSKLLSLLSLSEPMQEQIRSGELPVTAAYELTQVKNAAEQGQLAARVASGELTRDGLSGEIKARQRKQRGKRGPSHRPTHIIARLDGRQTVTVSASALDLNSLIELLGKLLSHAQQARTEGTSLDIFLKKLKNKPIEESPAPQAA